ncbi:MAG: hypothetical protein RL026_1319 [Pseudomonadota bacterium]|jgi:hypothetical protein
MENRVIRVARRFNGPPDSANGGYVCGLVCEAIGEDVTVRLLAPPPLDTDLQVLPHPETEGRWLVVHGGKPIIEARRENLDIPVPPTVGYIEALDAAVHAPDPGHHPCPGCFVCGTGRARGDGLRLFAGRVPDRDDVVATAWLPASEFCGDDGKVAPAIIAAALDCPGFHAMQTGMRLWLLGEYHCRIDRRVHAEEPCVIVGWKREGRGRRWEVGTALYDEDGELCAVARGTWIEPRS